MRAILRAIFPSRGIAIAGVPTKISPICTHQENRSRPLKIFSIPLTPSPTTTCPNLAPANRPNPIHPRDTVEPGEAHRPPDGPLSETPAAGHFYWAKRTEHRRFTMASEQQQDIATETPRPNHSTGPKTPEGKSLPPQRLSPRTHRPSPRPHPGRAAGLRQALPQSSSKPSPPSATSSASLPNPSPTTAGASIAPAPSRTSIFALGMHGTAADDTGAPQVDDAFAQARTWARTTPTISSS